MSEETKNELAVYLNTSIAISSRIDDWKTVMRKEADKLIAASDLSIEGALDENGLHDAILGFEKVSEQHKKLVKFRTGNTSFAKSIKEDAQKTVQEVDAAKREVISYTEDAEKRLKDMIDDYKRKEEEKAKAVINLRVSKLNAVNAKYQLSDVEKWDDSKFNEFLTLSTTKFNIEKEEEAINKERDEINRARIQLLRDNNAFDMYSGDLSLIYGVSESDFDAIIVSASDRMKRQKEDEKAAEARNLESQSRYQGLVDKQGIDLLPAEYAVNPSSLWSMPEEKYMELLGCAADRWQLQQMEAMRKNQTALIPGLEWDSGYSVLSIEQFDKILNDAKRHNQIKATLFQYDAIGEVPSEIQKSPNLAYQSPDVLNGYISSAKKKKQQLELAAKILGQQRFNELSAASMGIINIPTQENLSQMLQEEYAELLTSVKQAAENSRIASELMEKERPDMERFLSWTAEIKSGKSSISLCPQFEVDWLRVAAESLLTNLQTIVCEAEAVVTGRM